MARWSTITAAVILSVVAFILVNQAQACSHPRYGYYTCFIDHELVWTILWNGTDFRATFPSSSCAVSGTVGATGGLLQYNVTACSSTCSREKSRRCRNVVESNYRLEDRCLAFIATTNDGELYECVYVKDAIETADETISLYTWMSSDDADDAVTHASVSIATVTMCLVVAVALINLMGHVF